MTDAQGHRRTRPPRAGALFDSIRLGLSCSKDARVSTPLTFRPRLSVATVAGLLLALAGPSIGFMVAAVFGAVGNLWSVRRLHPGWILYGLTLCLIGYGLT
jgi:apolipoprotein N-acyltransferase